MMAHYLLLRWQDFADQDPAGMGIMIALWIVGFMILTALLLGMLIIWYQNKSDKQRAHRADTRPTPEGPEARTPEI